MTGEPREAKGRLDRSQARRRGFIAVTVLAAFVLLVPSPAVADDSIVTIRAPGFTAEPGECEPWFGIEGTVLERPYHLCVDFDVDPPKVLFTHIPKSYPYIDELNTTRCENTTGYVAHYQGTDAGACAKYEVREPDPDTFITTDVKLEPCKFGPERNGTDPTVQVEGGGVAVCADVIFDPDHQFPPELNVSAEPCDRRKSVDPEITIGSGRILFCVDYHFFGLTPDVDTPPLPGREDAVRILP